jgi:hypothetical protein
VSGVSRALPFRALQTATAASTSANITPKNYDHKPAVVGVIAGATTLVSAAPHLVKEQDWVMLWTDGETSFYRQPNH